MQRQSEAQHAWKISAYLSVFCMVLLRGRRTTHLPTRGGGGGGTDQDIQHSLYSRWQLKRIIAINIDATKTTEQGFFFDTISIRSR